MSRPRLITCLLGIFALITSCQRKDSETSTQSSQQARVARTQPGPAAASKWYALEQRRDVEGALEALEGGLSDAERAAAARALARIGGPKAHQRLRELLFDDHLEVVRWAAFGLGQDCDAVASQVKDLLSRAATLRALAPPGTERSGTLRAIAVALGRCGSDAAEEALRAWLGQPGDLSEHGAWGLGQLATRHGHLSEKAQVALLDTVAQRQAAAALYPFTRLSRLSEAVQARLLEISGQVLTTESSPLRSFAVRALPQAGAEASAALGQVLRNEAFSVEERAMAAQALARLGPRGQRVLEEVVAELPAPSFLRPTPSAVENTAVKPSALDSSALDPVPLERATLWSAVLRALEKPGKAKERLQELARLELPEPTNIVERRRAITLRCRAADLLAGPNSGDPRLRACDPDDTVQGALAVLRVLERAPLDPPRLATWRTLLEDPRPAIRQGALRLLAGHPEIPGAPVVLRQAIESDQLGTTVTALQLLTAYPARGAEDGAVDRALALAVEAVLRRKDWSQAVEVQAGALDALGALGILSTKGLVESYCQSPHYELRQHAARALGLLGDPKRRCNGSVLWPRQAAPSPGSVQLDLDSDIGPLRLHLEGDAAPAAVGRVAELARTGYYDGLAIHRVVEGFVVQFGDAPGDGFGDPKQTPLPCERSPEPFATFDVGMAIAGRDTASTQWFVTLERYPQLDGAYTRIGRAEGPWNRLAEGDHIRTVRVAE